MSQPSETNQNTNRQPEELKILITGDKPKNLLAGNSQSGAAAFSKPMTDLFEAVSERALAQIAKDNPGRRIVLLSGLELGIEQAAARRALEMGVEVRAFIPYKEHGKNWSDEFQKRYRDLIGEIAEKGSIVTVSDKEYSPQRTQLRDYRLVDEAQTVVSLHNPNQIPAHQKTLDYAAKHSKSIVNIWNDAEKQLAEVSKNFSDSRERNFTQSGVESPKIMTDSQTQNQESRKIEIRERITRQDLHAEPDKIFLFGDNLKQAGYGGQAKEMRGVKNAAGIPTKKEPSNKEESFFTDKEFEANKKAIAEAFDKIPPGKTIVIPRGGIGTGLARMEEKAPQTFAYLNAKLSEIGFDNRRGQEIVANVQTGGNKVIIQNSSDSPITKARLLDLSNIKTGNLRLLSPTSKEIDALKIDRAEALSNYAERLRRDYKANKGFLRDGLKTVSDALDKGEQITVACACRNGAMCHADVVKMAIEKINLHVKNQQIQETSRNENQSRSVQATAKNDSPKIENRLTPRTQRAIAEILGTSETDKLLEKINETDGRNQSEQASHLGKYSQFVRDIYERGGNVREGKLIVPTENLSLAPLLALTTESYAVERIGKILNDESRAKEIAPQIVEYGNKIAGLSTADGETKLKVFAWMYDALEGKSALLEGERDVARIGASRRDRFDDALENIGRLAEQMHALEPADKIEFAPLSDYEQDERSGSVWEERDENRALEEIYENAVGRDADGEITERSEELGEEIQNGERGFGSEAGAKIAAAEGYERIDLSDKPPSLPAEFTALEMERLLAETLPGIDRQLESGVSVKEILKPFHENVRQSGKDDALNRLEAIFQRQKIGELETELLDSALSGERKEKIESEIARWKNLVLTPTAEEAREILAGRAVNDLKGKQTIAEFARKTGNLSEGVKEQIERIDVRRQNVIELKTPGEFRAALEAGEKTFYQKTKIETAELLVKLEARETKENSPDKAKENQIKKQLNELRDLRPSFAFKIENSAEIIVGRVSAKSLDERAFVASYVNFQLRQPETRLRYESERYRIYAKKLEAATTRGEVIKTAAEIRIENAASGLKLKDSETGEKEKQPRPLSQKEMQFLFTETSPAHYTAEMTVARLSFAHSGESRRQMTAALIKGEIKPSPEAQKLIDSLESRLTRAKLQDSIGATKHFFESLKTRDENLKYKNAFDHREIYRNLPPQEKDFVYAKATAQRENLEYRFAFEQRRQIFGKSNSRDELQTYQPPSRIERSFYYQSYINQARVLGERVETSPLGSKEITDRDFRAAQVLLQNQPPEKINGFSQELKQSASVENRKLGEILETFGKAEKTRADSKTTVEIKLPENALVGTETYKELLERFYSDDRRESDKFKFSNFSEKTIEAARIKGQDETLQTWRDKLGGNVYANGTSAAVFQTERAVVEHLSSITRLQQAARDARAENTRILEKYSSRAAHKLQIQKLQVPTIAEQKQIVKAALGFSGGDRNLTADGGAKQFLEAAQKEITISDLNRFETSEKLIAENMTGIKRGFSEIADRQNILDESKVKLAEISAETRLQDAYLKTQQLEENRSLTLAARGAFERETAVDLEARTIGDLVAQNEKDEIKAESATRARVALEPEYKDFEAKEYNEQALKLADAIENAHELSKGNAPASEIAAAFDAAEKEKAILLQKTGGAAIEKTEDKPHSLRLYEAEIKRAERQLITESLRAKILAGVDYSESQLTLNLDKIFSAQEREKMKTQASEIAKSRLEPKELDADHRKIPTEAGKQAVATFKQLEQAHNVFQFSSDKSKIHEAFLALDREAAMLNQFRQNYDKIEKLALLREGVKTDLGDLLRENQNLSGAELSERTTEILRENFARAGFQDSPKTENRVETLTREIVEKIEAKEKTATKEKAVLPERSARDFERGAPDKQPLEMNGAKEQKAREAYVLAR